MKKNRRDMKKLGELYLASLLEGDSEESRHLAAQALELLGYSDFYDEFLVPSLREIGRGWEKGNISVASEHRASAIVRENLSWVRAMIPRRDSLNLRCVAAAVEGDPHDLGLRIFCDLLTFDGWEVDFVGANTPTSELIRFAETVHPDLFVVSATNDLARAPLEVCVRELGRIFPDTPVLVGGAASQEADLSGSKICKAETHFNKSIEKIRQMFELEHRTKTLAQYLVYLGGKVQELRKARGWSQAHLASLAELDRTYLSSLENGKQNLSLAVAYRLAAALQVPLVSLLGDAADKTWL